MIMFKRNQNTESSVLNLLGNLLVYVFALVVVDYLIEGFTLMDLRATVVAAVVVGVINTYLRPIAQFVALPLSVLTLGIGFFVVNALLLMLAAVIVPGFEITGFIPAALASLLLSLISSFLSKQSKK